MIIIISVLFNKAKNKNRKLQTRGMCSRMKQHFMLTALYQLISLEHWANPHKVIQKQLFTQKVRLSIEGSIWKRH